MEIDTANTDIRFSQMHESKVSINSVIFYLFKQFAPVLQSQIGPAEFNDF